MIEGPPTPDDSEKDGRGEGSDEENALDSSEATEDGGDDWLEGLFSEPYGGEGVDLSGDSSETEQETSGNEDGYIPDWLKGSEPIESLTESDTTIEQPKQPINTEKDEDDYIPDWLKRPKPTEHNTQLGTHHRNPHMDIPPPENNIDSKLKRPERNESPDANAREWIKNPEPVEGLGLEFLSATPRSDINEELIKLGREKTGPITLEDLGVMPGSLMEGVLKIERKREAAKEEAEINAVELTLTLEELGNLVLDLEGLNETIGNIAKEYGLDEKIVKQMLEINRGPENTLPTKTEAKNEGTGSIKQEKNKGKEGEKKDYRAEAEKWIVEHDMALRKIAKDSGGHVDTFSQGIAELISGQDLDATTVLGIKSMALIEYMRLVRDINTYE